MQCIECYWCVINETNTKDKYKCCGNEKSQNYTKIFSKEENYEEACENGESRVVVDYRALNAWQFAAKYYG